MKKGFFYAISIFLLAAVLLELLAFSAEYSSRARHGIIVPSDAQALSYRINTLSSIALQVYGINISISRNSTDANLTIYDAGFPLFSPSSSGNFNSGSFSNAASNFSSGANFSLSYDASTPNSTGLLIMSSSGINYTHENEATDSDKATLWFPSSDTINSLVLRVNCTMPSSWNSVSYTSWSSTSPQVMTLDSVYFSSGSTPESSTFNNKVDMDQNNTFYANYTSSGNWAGTIFMNWTVTPSNYSWSITSQVNTSSFSKSDVNCYWNATAGISLSSSEEFIVYAPIEATAQYGNAHYFGNLTIARN